MEFLRRVLPPGGGLYCIVGIKKGVVNHRFFPQLDGIEDVAKKMADAEYNVYFACATFVEEAKGRKVENIYALKSFFLDVDCGEDKPYLTKEDGLAAVKAFVKQHDLPKPWLVDSGGGVHVYWELQEEIKYDDWRIVAEKLKLLCHESKFKSDPAVTADGARILRLPGTLNLKESLNPRPVTLLLKGDPVNFDDLKAKINPLSTWVAPRSGWRELDEVTKNLLGRNFVSSFKQILKKTMEGVGCAQLQYIVENQAEISEPLWRAGLSIAAFCEDGDKAIHVISKHHPNYSKEDTIKKASQIKGPYTCEKIAGYGDPSLCQTCKHKDSKITSPITLGRQIAEAEERFVTALDTVIQEEVTFEIPDYPSPYFRGKSGGVYRRPWHDEEEPRHIYENDFYLVKRYHDPDEGDVAVARLHTPKDGVKEFSIPVTSVVTSDRFKDVLGKNGVYALPGKPYEDIRTYFTSFLQHMQRSAKADIAQVHMGWADDMKSFIIGCKEVTPAGVTHGPPSRYTHEVASNFHKKGSLEEWKTAVNAYTLPHMETHAFLFLSAFGAPLMKFTPYNAITFVAKSPGGGTGKTTLLHAINSVWGHPDKIMNFQQDTINYKMNRVGVYCNLPVCWDEMTGIDPQDLSHVIYTLTNGRGKGRMERSYNVERKNYSEWKTIVVWSANQDMGETLQQIKKSPEAEMTRFIEFHCEKSPLLPKYKADELFGRLKDNYGIAGEIYAAYLIEHTEEVKEAVQQMNRILDTNLRADTKMRFWTAAAACNLVGGAIAKRLGLINFNMKDIERYICKEIGQTRAELTDQAVGSYDGLGEFMRYAYNNTLVVNAGRTGMMGEAPFREPKGQVAARVELDTGLIYISVQALKEYCANQGLHYNAIIGTWEKMKYVRAIKNVKIFRGTQLPGNKMSVRCIELDVPDENSKDEILDFVKTGNSQSEVLGGGGENEGG